MSERGGQAVLDDSIRTTQFERLTLTDHHDKFLAHHSVGGLRQQWL